MRESRRAALSLIGISLVAIVALAVVMFSRPAEAPAAASANASPGAAPPAAERSIDTGRDVRQALPIAHDAASEPPAPAATARLTVLVVRAGSLAPVAAAKVSLGERTATTDAGGRATFDAEPGSVWLGVEPPAGDLAGVEGRVNLPIADDSLRIVLRDPVGVSFWARLSTGTPARPLAGLALWHTGRAGRQPVQTDEGGLVYVAGDASTDFLTPADAWSPVRIALLPGHATSATALEVWLEPPATLRLELGEGERMPVADAGVRVDYMSDDVTVPPGVHRGNLVTERIATTGADGGAVLDGLPSRITLRLRIERDGLLLHQEPIELQPGDNRVQRTLAGSGRIAGTLHDQDGAPIADVPLALASFGDGREGELQPALRATDREAARTDAQGGFAFGTVPAGNWLLGVAPIRAPDGTRQSLPCTLATAKVVVFSGATSEVTLIAHRGLYIGGRAIDRAELPASVDIAAVREDAAYRASARSASDGAFRIGPLLPGDYWLRCGFAMEDPFVLSQPVRVRAGTDGIELALDRGAGSVAGRISSTTGLPTAWVTLRHHEADDAVARRADLDGSFVFDGLRPGLWGITAATADEAATNAAVLVRAGACTDVALELQAAGALQIEYVVRAPRDIEFEVLAAGSRCFSERLAAVGEPGRCRLALPPGAYTVRLLADGRELLREDRLVQQGATAIVRWP